MSWKWAKGLEDVHGDVIADQIVSVGEEGRISAMHHRWNNEETLAFRLQHEEGPACLPGWELSVPRLKSMFMKMKKGKASPDGITAEILQTLQDKLVSKLGDFLKVHGDSPFNPLPEEFRASEAM